MDPAEQFMQSLLTSGPNDSVLQAQSGVFSTSDHDSQVGDKSDDDDDDNGTSGGGGDNTTNTTLMRMIYVLEEL